MRPRRFDDDDYNDRRPRREERDLLNKYRHKIYDYDDSLDEENDDHDLYGDDTAYYDDSEDERFEQDPFTMNP